MTHKSERGDKVTMGRTAEKVKRVKFNPHLGDLDEYLAENERLIYHVTKRYASRAEANGMDYEDIVQCGFMGFVKAYERFDPTAFKGTSGNGVKFSTYAVPMIKGEILRLIRDHNPGAKFSRNAKETAYKIIHGELEDKTPEEVAKILDVPLSYAEDGFDFIYFSKATSTETPTGGKDDTDSITIGDTLSSRDDHTVMFVNDFLDTLSEKDQTVIQGVMEGLTQSAIAEQIGVTQVQVSRILKKIGEKYLEYQKREEDELSHKEMVEEAKRLIRDTEMSYKDIAAETGVSYATVAYHGLNIRGKTIGVDAKPKKNPRKTQSKSKNTTSPKAEPKAEPKVTTKPKPAPEVKNKRLEEGKKILEELPKPEPKTHVTLEEVTETIPQPGADVALPEPKETSSLEWVGAPIPPLEKSKSSAQVVNFTLKGEAKSSDQLVSEFSKMVEMFGIYEAEDVTFFVQIKSKEAAACE